MTKLHSYARSKLHKKQSLKENSERGIIAVEFALILPVLMLILIATIEAGLVMYDYIIITNASREGARWGIISDNNPGSLPWSCSGTGTTPTTPCGVANNFASTLLISYASTNLPTTTATGGGTPGSTVTVTTSYPYSGIGTIAFGDFNLVAISKMNYE